MPFAPKTQGRFNPLEALVERMVSRSESDIDTGGRFGIAKLLGLLKVGKPDRPISTPPSTVSWLTIAMSADLNVGAIALKRWS